MNTTDETTYKTFNYEKFSYTLQGDSGANGFFIESPWYVDDPAFTGVNVSNPGKATGEIVCSMGTIGENFDPPFPKTIELTATDGSTHIFSSGIEFEIDANSGLETAQSITAAIDAHPLFSASLEVPNDLFHYNHYEYNLDLVIKLEQHLMGIEGNTPIQGTFFENIPIGGSVVISTPWGFNLGSSMRFGFSATVGAYPATHNTGVSFTPLALGVGGNLTLAKFIFMEGHGGLVGDASGARGFAGVSYFQKKTAP